MPIPLLCNILFIPDSGDDKEVKSTESGGGTFVTNYTLNVPEDCSSVLVSTSICVPILCQNGITAFYLLLILITYTIKLTLLYNICVSKVKNRSHANVAVCKSTRSGEHE